MSALGAACAIAACLLWGMDVLVPLLLGDFSPAAITASRFLCYGLVSVVVLLVRGRWGTVLRLSPRLWLKCLVLGTGGEVLYYFCVSSGVNLVDAAVVAVLVGMLPVTVTVAGSRGPGAVPLRGLIRPSALILLGVLVVNVVEIDWAGLGERSLAQQLAGIGCALLGVALWTWFVVTNARVLRRHAEVSAADWAAMLGVATMLPAAATAPFVVDADVLARGPLRLLAGGLVLGVAVSWLGTVLWNQASRTLPVALLGQLMVFETIAALGYVFVANAKMPTIVELAGIGVTLLGLSFGIARCRPVPPSGKDSADAYPSDTAARTG